MTTLTPNGVPSIEELSSPTSGSAGEHEAEGDPEPALVLVLASDPERGLGRGARRAARVRPLVSRPRGDALADGRGDPARERRRSRRPRPGAHVPAIGGGAPPGRRGGRRRPPAPRGGRAASSQGGRDRLRRSDRRRRHGRPAPFRPPRDRCGRAGGQGRSARARAAPPGRSPLQPRRPRRPRGDRRARPRGGGLDDRDGVVDVEVDGLVSGMRLARDVHVDGGALLAKAGTTVTDGLVFHLRNLVRSGATPPVIWIETPGGR